MSDKLSQKVKEEVKRLLPELREKVKKEFKEWYTYHDNEAFYSDEALMQILPFAAYDFLLLNWCIKPDRIKYRDVIYTLDNRLFGHLPLIISHALRKLAGMDTIIVSRQESGDRDYGGR